MLRAERMKNIESHIKNFIGVSKTLFIPIALIFLFLVIYENIEFLKHKARGRDKNAFQMAIFLWIFLHFLHPATVVTALWRRFSASDYPACLRIHLRQLPARYLPGGIWHTAARFAHYLQLGITRGELVLLGAIENIFAVIITLGTGFFIYLLTRPEVGNLIFLTYFLIAATLISAGVFALNRISSAHNLKLTTANFLANTIVQSAYWSVAASSFTMYCYAVFPDSQITTVETFCAYLISWGIGFIAFFAPQGIGIFELSAGVILQEHMTITELAALLLGFRLVVLIADVLGWVISFIFWNPFTEKINP